MLLHYYAVRTLSLSATETSSFWHFLSSENRDKSAATLYELYPSTGNIEALGFWEAKRRWTHTLFSDRGRRLKSMGRRTKKLTCPKPCKYRYRGYIRSVILVVNVWWGEINAWAQYAFSYKVIQVCFVKILALSVFETNTSTSLGVIWNPCDDIPRISEYSNWSLNQNRERCTIKQRLSCDLECDLWSCCARDTW